MGRRTAITAVVTQIAHGSRFTHLFFAKSSLRLLEIDFVVIHRRIGRCRRFEGTHGAGLLRILVNRVEWNGPAVFFVDQNKFRRRTPLSSVPNIFDDNVATSLRNVYF